MCLNDNEVFEDLQRMEDRLVALHKALSRAEIKIEMLRRAGAMIFRIAASEQRPRVNGVRVPLALEHWQKTEKETR